MNRQVRSLRCISSVALDDAPMKPPVILSGPSGVGKTTLCKYLQKKGWLYLEADLLPPKDGIDELSLRSEWDSFWINKTPQILSARLRELAADHVGVILSLSSRAIAEIPLIAASEPMMKIRFLWGDRDRCRCSFLARELQNGGNLGVKHWNENNELSCRTLSLPQYEPYLVNAFAVDGSRIPLSQLEQSFNL